MSNTIYRVLGKRGRITIPYDIRQQTGFSCNDILSFTRQDDDTILVRREKICNCSQNPLANRADTPPMTLKELLDSLTPAQQRAALVHLSGKWADRIRSMGRIGKCV